MTIKHTIDFSVNTINAQSNNGIENSNQRAENRTCDEKMYFIFDYMILTQYISLDVEGEVTNFEISSSILFRGAQKN